MAILEIVKGEDQPVLRTRTPKVPKVTKDVLKLVRDLEDTLDDVTGLGLAATQVRQPQRVCIATINGKLTTLINPEITWRSEETTTEEEGCLSIPNKHVPVTRAKEIIVKYLDEKGREQERKLQDIDACVVQHEVDHLDGILIVDYITPHKDVLHFPTQSDISSTT